MHFKNSRKKERGKKETPPLPASESCGTGEPAVLPSFRSQIKTNKQTNQILVKSLGDPPASGDRLVSGQTVCPSPLSRLALASP